MIHRFLPLSSIAGILLALTAGTPKILKVGPGQAYARPCAAILAAAPGDTIEIDSEGIYDGDVCAWKTGELTIRGTGSDRAVLSAQGKNAQGKAIWVIAGDNNTIENIEFTGEKVPDHNGAGIRFESTNLTVRNCYFHDNEEGILGGNDTHGIVLVEYSEFARNGYEDGQSHNIYIGHSAKFIFRFNYSHESRVGHLLKSRAAENDILYNRLSDEEGGTGSYELDLPNGGLSYVLGNVIEQGPRTENNTILSYLEEGRTPLNAQSLLFIENNTFVNHHMSGANRFIFISPADAIPAVIRNNIFAGPGDITNQSIALLRSNYSGDPGFVDDAAYDFRVKKGSATIGSGSQPSSGLQFSLVPEFQYVHPACGERIRTGGALDIGAFPFEGGTGEPAPTAPSRCVIESTHPQSERPAFTKGRRRLSCSPDHCGEAVSRGTTGDELRGTRAEERGGLVGGLERGAPPD